MHTAVLSHRIPRALPYPWQAFRSPRSVRDGPASEIAVVASAPGKVILFGEHAVVYGKTAVGAAVSDLRVVVTAVRESTAAVAAAAAAVVLVWGLGDCLLYTSPSPRDS